MKNWKAECPKCQHIEHSEEKGTKCGNCEAPAIMSFGISKDGWQDDSARQSWRQMQCSRRCGWTQNQATCSNCGATIRGDYFKGNAKWCFVATSAFNNENHPTVQSLRDYRDQTLAQSEQGMNFINFYYEKGQKAAKILNKYPIFKPVIRFLLNTFVRFIK